MSEPSWWDRARALYKNPRLSFRAVARILGKDPSTVRYAVNARGREHKRQLMKKYNRRFAA